MSFSFGWFYLFIAIFFEILMLLIMKTTSGFKNFFYGFLILFFFSFSLFFENLAIKYIDLTLSYTVWVGSGLIIISLIDYFFFSTKINFIGFISIFFIFFFMILLSFKGIDLNG